MQGFLEMETGRNHLSLSLSASDNTFPDVIRKCQRCFLKDLYDDDWQRPALTASWLVAQFEILSADCQRQLTRNPSQIEVAHACAYTLWDHMRRLTLTHFHVQFVQMQSVIQVREKQQWLKASKNMRSFLSQHSQTLHDLETAAKTTGDLVFPLVLTLFLSRIKVETLE